MDKELLRKLREGRYAYGRAWKATGRLHRPKNGLNLEVKKAKTPYRYERECFQMLLRKFSGRGEFVVGSFLTDFLLSESPQWHGTTRPDALIFRLNGTMKLIGLAEFRTGVVMADDKLHGFAGLVQQLRKDQDYLPGALSEIAAPWHTLPISWEIPSSNRDIKIHFFTPHTNAAGEIFSAETPFQVAHRFVPYDRGR